MFKLIHVRGFQNHKDTRIELGPITVLIGDNDQGKSALVRAMKWVGLNEWDGKATEFINWDMDTCEVELHTEKHIVTRHRGKENLYVIDGEKLGVLRQGFVPDVVKKILNLGPDNFQNQNEAQFWLYLSPGQAAQALNEIFNLTAIDDAVADIGSQVRDARGRKSMIETRITDLERAKKELDWVPEADKSLRQIESLNKDIGQLVNERDGLIIDLARVEQHEQEQKINKKRLALAQRMLKLAQENELLRRQLLQVRTIFKLEQDLCNLRGELVKQQAKLDQFLKERCPLCGRQ